MDFTSNSTGVNTKKFQQWKLIKNKYHAHCPILLYNLNNTYLFPMAFLRQENIFFSSSWCGFSKK